MRDIVEGRGDDLLSGIIDFEPDSLQAGLSDVNTPSSGFTCHSILYGCGARNSEKFQYP
jgi:hypothetical protein